VPDFWAAGLSAMTERCQPSTIGDQPSTRGRSLHRRTRMRIRRLCCWWMRSDCLSGLLGVSHETGEAKPEIARNTLPECASYGSLIPSVFLLLVHFCGVMRHAFTIMPVRC